jgi:hypothetical protein
MALYFYDLHVNRVLMKINYDYGVLLLKTRTTTMTIIKQYNLEILFSISATEKE